MGALVWSQGQGLTPLQAPGWDVQVGPDQCCLPVTRCPSGHPPSARPAGLSSQQLLCSRCYGDEEAEACCCSYLVEVPCGWLAGRVWVGLAGRDLGFQESACTQPPSLVCGLRLSPALWVPTMPAQPARGWMLARGGGGGWHGLGQAVQTTEHYCQSAADTAAAAPAPGPGLAPRDHRACWEGALKSAFGWEVRRAGQGLPQSTWPKASPLPSYTSSLS